VFRPFTNKVFLYISLLFLIVGAVFYTSDMRRQTEEFLFDIVVRALPTLKPTDKVLTIALDTKNLTTLAKKKLLTSVINKALDANVERVYATYFLSEYDYSKKLPFEIAKYLSEGNRLKILTLGLNQEHPISVDFPANLEPYKTNVMGMDALRGRSYSIVRRVPTKSYRGLEKANLFPHELLKDRGGRQNQAFITLRNVKTNTFTVSKLSETPSFANAKIVIIGQKKYKPWGSQTVEPPTINTPFRNNTYNVSEGTSALEFATIQTQNIIQRKELTVVWAPFAIIFQIIIACIAAYFLLKFEVERLLIPTIFVCINLAATITSAHFLSLYLPTADFSFLSTALQILMVAQFAENNFLEKEKQVIERRERKKLDSVYSLFISDLADHLIKKNKSITKQLLETNTINLNSDQCEMLQGTISSSDDFAEFLRGISTLSNVDMSKIDDGSCKQVLLKNLITRVLERFKNDAKDNSTRFINYVDPSLEIETNLELLDAIIQNLISNALKYSPKGTEIEVSAEKKPNNIIIQIKDYGYGISKSNQSRIFEKFYRVKDDHVYQKPGSGIGLYLSRLFARQLGGDITLVSSKKGEGSVFQVKVQRNA